MIGPDGIMRLRCLNLNCAQRSPLVTSMKRRQFIMGLGGAAMWLRAGARSTLMACGASVYWPV